MLRTLAILFGLLLVTIGVMGFLPNFTTEGMLFSIFKVNAMHNIIHLASGILAISSGISSRGACKAYFIIFALIYGALAVLGFIYGDPLLLGMIANNTADSWLHSIFAAVCLYFGLFIKG